MIYFFGLIEVSITIIMLVVVAINNLIHILIMNYNPSSTIENATQLTTHILKSINVVSNDVINYLTNSFITTI